MSLSVKIILAILGFAGVFLGIAFFIVFPIISDIQSIKSQIVALRDDSLKMDDRIMKVRQFREFSKREKENFEMADDLLIDSQMPEFIDYMEGAATMAGVEVVFLPSISKSDDEGEWPSMSYQADITGDIDRILDLVRRIEVCPYLVQIEGFSIKAGAEQSLKGDRQAINDQLNLGMAHILLKVYVKK